MWQGKGVFSFSIISQLWRPIELKLSQNLLFYSCWDTPSEKTGRWQLPILYSVFIVTSCETTHKCFTWIMCRLWTSLWPFPSGKARFKGHHSKSTGHHSNYCGLGVTRLIILSTLHFGCVPGSSYKTNQKVLFSFSIKCEWPWCRFICLIYSFYLGNGIESLSKNNFHYMYAIKKSTLKRIFVHFSSKLFNATLLVQVTFYLLT